MDFPICFSKTPLLWIALLGIPVLISAGFMGYGFFSIFFTALVVLILYSIILTFSKPKKPSHGEKLGHEEEELLSESQPDQSVSKLQTQIDEEESPEGEEGQIQDDFLIGPSPDSYSESDSIAYSSATLTDQESDEVDWPYSGSNLYQCLDSSDGSISDEESLIEIALPSGHFLASPKKEEPRSRLKQKFPEEQQSPVELLAEINEINEEENLIEIDISMGSIKCSRFEIEA